MYNNYLAHHGIKSQKWGVRRYQRADGSLTSAGLKRYNAYQQASDKANKFSKYAKEDAKRYIKSGDKRLAKISEQQAKRYAELAKNYKISDVTDSKAYKKAKNFVKKAYFTEAEFGDVSVGKNKRINYIDNKYIVNNREIKQQSKEYDSYRSDKLKKTLRSVSR